MERKINRWLRALEIARTIFETEGYHTRYLREIENFIRKRKEEVDERFNTS